MASLLRRRHRLGQADDDFELQDQDALYATRLSAGGSMRRLVAGLAALALVLGGSGLLAVCLLSVRERRSEIGLRLAVGARRRDIFVQFLAEAILLSLLGTAAGLAVTFTVIAVGERLLGWPLAIGRFGHRLRQAETAAAGLAELRRHRPDLLILDIMLPDRDGLSVCRAIRTESDVPILMLTARGEVADRVVGLEMGADDYLPQPFEPREFTTYCAG